MFHTILHAVYFLVVILAPIVFIHEMGHYLATKAFGGAVERFSIGFGPVLWSRKDRSGTQWCLSAIPIGGYIKPVPEAIPGVKGRPLGAMNRLQRIIVMAAGPTANFVLAIALYTAVFLHVGIPSGQTTVEKVTAASPAYTAGVQVGDIITRIDGTRVHDAFAAMEIFSTNIAPDVTIQVTRGTDSKAITVHTQPKIVHMEDGRTVTTRLLGITMKTPEKRHANIIETTAYATNALYRQVVLSVESFGQIITGHRSTTNMRGMIGIAQESTHMNYNWLVQLQFAATISIGLGVANLLPISTVLDGGKILVLLVESAMRRNMPERMERGIEFLSLAVILALLLITTGQDLFFLFLGHPGHG